MDTDDPRQPLLDDALMAIHFNHWRYLYLLCIDTDELGFYCCPPKSKWRDVANRLCNLESWRRRMPITIWLPNYSFSYLLRDAIAGITVGLTSIPQGIAYAILAGLPPQIGLYSSIFPGIVYAIFGSCKDVTVGPTAILAALLAKYVAQSPDFAYLAAFLSGFVILLLGILQLGFLLDFISKPVISGFTTAAALQISASQLKSLFRVTGASGGTFIKSMISFFENIHTVQLWDTLLGLFSILALLLIKRTTMKTQETDSRRRILFAKSWLYVVRARNALVVFGGLLLAYLLYLYGIQPFALTGTIRGGLPNFGPPPFSTLVGNNTLNFERMLETFGPEGFAMPLVAILESIAIAKAFAKGKTVDATQEMIAIGACNLLSSFAQSMPATGSFTRTALNHASGVVTPAGCLFKAATVLLAVTLLAEAFFFIPRATLAAIIMVAMFSLLDLTIVKKLWISSKSELLTWLLTVVVGVWAGLEYGIAAGAGADAARALAAAARPQLYMEVYKVGVHDVTQVHLQGALSYACAEHVARVVRRARTSVVVLHAGYLRRADVGVAENLITAIEELEDQKYRFLLWNFDVKHQKLFESLQPKIADKFVSGTDIKPYILGLNDRNDSTLSSVM